MITHDLLVSLILYVPETGIFIRIGKVGRKGKIGSEMGCVSGPGYFVIGVAGRPYYAHRLAWFYMTKKWPDGLVDHRDGNPLNNAWENLRCADKSQNALNARRSVSNTSGFKGVSWHAAGSKWQAHCGPEYLGLFDTKEDAHAAYMMAAGEFGRSI